MGRRIDKDLADINLAPIPRMMKDTARSSAEHCYRMGKLDAADEIFAELDKLFEPHASFSSEAYEALRKRFTEEK
jgi:hypothetical protein